MSALDSELELALERIPELADTGRVVTPIAGGMTNRNVQVRTADGNYVVRLGVKETGQLGIDRDNEDRNSRLAAAAGVGVRVVARLRDPEALVVEFVSGTIRIGTTGDPEIREWAHTLWSRAVDEFESPEFEQLLELAARPEGD